MEARQRLGSDTRPVRKMNMLILLKQMIPPHFTITIDQHRANMCAASRGCKSVGSGPRGGRHHLREASRKATTPRVSKSPRRRCLFCQEKLLACSSSITFSSTRTPSLLWASAEANAAARRGQVRSRVCVSESASGRPLFSGMDGRLHSFLLSNVRHAVDHLDYIWALILQTLCFPFMFIYLVTTRPVTSPVSYGRVALRSRRPARLHLAVCEAHPRRPCTQVSNTKQRVQNPNKS